VDRRSWVLLVILGAVWGASFLLTAIAIRDLTVPVVSLFRTGIGALVLLPIALARSALAGAAQRLGPILVLAVVQLAGPFLLIGYGQRHVDSGLAGILVASTPLWTALIAVRFDHEERSRGWNLAGVGIGIVGVALLLGVQLEGSLDTMLGALMLLLAGLGYAAGGFLAKHSVPGLAPLGVLTAAMIAGSVVLAPFALAALPSEAPRAGPLLAALALGAVSGGLGWFLYYTVLASAGAARAAIALYIVPAFAVFYGVLLLDEPLTAASLGGLVMVVAGSALAARTPRTQPGAAAEDAAPDADSTLR
jgi:drug/metabolite transporter (DMT)-like permease